MDITSLSDSDLMAISEGNMSQVSDEGLSVISGGNQWKQKVSDIAHAGLPIAGGMAGGVAGTASPIPGGMYIGGAGGFALGEQSADVLDEFMGLSKPKDLKESAINALENIYSGVEAESIGGVIGKTIINPAIKVGKYIKSANRAPVAQVLDDIARPSDAANIARAEEVKTSIPGFDYTSGMGTGNREMLALERAATQSGKEGFGPIQQRVSDIQQGNISAVDRRLQSIAPGQQQDFIDEISGQVRNADEVLAKGQSINRQDTGQAIRDSIETAQIPVKDTVTRLGEEIPNYNMQRLTGMDDATQLTLRDSRRIPAHKDIISFKQFATEQIKKNGNTTHTIMGLRRDLNERINKAFNSGNDSTGEALLKIKNGIDKDLASMGEKARTGKLHTYNGQTVNPDDLAQELETNLINITELRASAKPDMQKMQQALQERKIPFNQVTGQGDESFMAQISKDYQRATGEEIPMINQSGKAISEIEKRNIELRKVLSNIEPGRDVAASMNAYNKYSEKELFGRFGTQQIKASQNANLALENVPRKFATATGADELIGAVGKTQASSVMRNHYTAELGKFGDKSGSDSIVKWLKDNRQALGKYGLVDEYTKEVRKLLGQQQLRKIIKTDTNTLFSGILSQGSNQQKAILLPIIKRIGRNEQAKEGLKSAYLDYLRSQVITPMAAGKQGFGRVEKLFKQMEPTTDLLLTQAEKTAVNEVRDAVRITQRMTESTPLGGSHTAELLQKGKDRLIAGRELGLVARVVIGSGVAGTVTAATGSAIAGGAMVPLANNAAKALLKHGDDAARKFFLEAMFNPKQARLLSRISKAKKITSVMEKDIAESISRLSAYVTITAKSNGRIEDELNPQP